VNFNTVSRIKKFLSRSTQESGLSQKDKKKKINKKKKEPQSSYKLNLKGLKLFIRASKLFFMAFFERPVACDR